MSELLVVTLADGTVRILGPEYNIEKAPDGTVTAVKVRRPRPKKLAKTVLRSKGLR